MPAVNFVDRKVGAILAPLSMFAGCQVSGAASPMSATAQFSTQACIPPTTSRTAAPMSGTRGESGFTGGSVIEVNEQRRDDLPSLDRKQSSIRSPKFSVQQKIPFTVDKLNLSPISSDVTQPSRAAALPALD
jgi:hypothetical protein